MSTATNPQDSTPEAPPSFKEQLDRKATEHNTPPAEPSLMEKVAQYIPDSVTSAIGGSLKAAKDKPDTEQAPEVPADVPPERPHHDNALEEFVRDQHRSNSEQGELADISATKATTT